jgi:hypothetical protein
MEGLLSRDLTLIQGGAVTLDVFCYGGAYSNDPREAALTGSPDLLAL